MIKINMSGYKKTKTSDIKKTSTLENKHRQKTKEFECDKNNLDTLSTELNLINRDIIELDKIREKFTLYEQKKRADLLDKKDELEKKIYLLKNNISEMDYYDKTGDLLITYYDVNYTNEQSVESKNILTFLCKKRIPDKNTDNEKSIVNRTELFEKYCQITEGVRITQDDGSKRIKYCLECKIEKILDPVESAYSCPLCGDMEIIIFDEDVQIKDYSPYKRLNRFREWLNAFQAKQSPDIDEKIYEDIYNELNKTRITDLSTLNRIKMRAILKKLGYNKYYEHTHYIINKLSNLPPPKITKDMEKVFIRMFLMIQEPWLKYKPIYRKNFLSYSFVLHKFCELLELDHLLDCFPLHKQLDILMENDTIWKKICGDLSWDFISSIK
jgi:hypothetical protein